MTDINLASFIWSVADWLRGDYKQSENARVILPVQITEPAERVSDGR
jgi:type I restriction enzyme M protein